MRHSIILLFLSLLFFIQCADKEKSGSSADYWAKPFFAEQESWCISTLTTQNNIFAGINVGEAGSYSCTPVLTKLNPDGTLHWAKTIKHGSYSEITCMNEIDNYIFLAGRVASEGKSLMFVIKSDYSGNIVWESFYEVSGLMLIPGDITKADNNTIMLTGRLQGQAHPSHDLWVLRLIPNGTKNYNVEWFKTYDHTYTDSNGNVAHANETGISVSYAYSNIVLVAGHIQTPMYSYDPWFIIIETDGTFLSQSRLKTGDCNAQVTSMQKISANDPKTEYIVSGFTNHKSNSFDMFALKLEYDIKSKDKITSGFQRIYDFGDTDYGYDVGQVTDGNFILIGTSQLTHTNSMDAIILKIENNKAGASILSSAYGNATISGNFPDRFYSVCKSNNNGFIVGGSTKTFPSQKQQNAWIMSLNEYGQVDQKIWDDKCMFYKIDITKEWDPDWNWGCMSEKIEVVENDINYNIIAKTSKVEDFEINSLYLCDDLKP